MRHIFVITYGRSGSTVLMNLLNRIPGYNIRGENNGIITHLALCVSRLRQAQERYRDVSHGPASPWYGICDPDVDECGSRLAEFFSQTFLSGDENVRATGFKEIRFTPHDISDEEYDSTISFLSEYFSNSLFIFNTRNWREVSESGWWRYNPSLNNVRTTIEDSDKRFRKTKGLLGERAFLIDYSEFDGKPDGFRPLLDWLNETLSEEDLKYVCSKKLTHVTRPKDDRGRLFRLKRHFL